MWGNSEVSNYIAKRDQLLVAPHNGAGGEIRTLEAFETDYKSVPVDQLREHQHKRDLRLIPKPYESLNYLASFFVN